MGSRLDRLRTGLRNDRGSLAMAVVIWAPVVVLLMAFLVDVGLLISDRTQASDYADQAARRVAQDIDQGWLKTHNVISTTGAYPGIKINVDPAGDCMPDAQQYLLDNQIADTTITSCQVTGNPTDANPYVNPQITVTLQMQYKPLFVGFALKGDTTVTGTGTATPVIPK
ncbi:Flp pilus assembly protein TadG [Catenulispora sp. GP43]|uniref:TadE/TadG family type IV pilus assembly protein n=1 Tax=Catenulispora sp. GP43 TaxID=3156263 RepID=UPI003514C437